MKRGAASGDGWKLLVGGTVAFAVVILVVVGFVYSTRPRDPNAPKATASTAPKTVECPAADVTRFLATTSSAMAAFQDHLARAGSTARIALSPVVADMQTTRRDYASAARPECANATAEATIAAMDDNINGILAFMRDSQDEAEQFQRHATEDYQHASDEIARLKVKVGV